MSGFEMFNSIFTDTTLTGSDFLIATGCSVVCGLIIALLYNIRNHCSKSLLITLAVLPAGAEETAKAAENWMTFSSRTEPYYSVYRQGLTAKNYTGEPAEAAL